MFRLAFSFAILSIVSAPLLPASEAPQSVRVQTGEKKAQPPPKKEAAASLTGCVDEQDGHYILINDRSRDPIADLVADGFETEGFAKHVGHKVTIRGTQAPPPESGRPVFKVRTIETVSESCEPHAIE